MRIIAGELRGRQLTAPLGLGIRPTADRTREALFNLLEHGRLARDGSIVAGAAVLDVFAGTGALALEALSRGAEVAVAMDRDTAAIAAIKANARALALEDALTVVKANVLKPPPARFAADLVLLDPPYGESLGEPALLALGNAGWIGPNAVVALETGAKEDFTPPPGFELTDARRYGRAKLWLMVRG